jgi:hypothetical protein
MYKNNIGILSWLRKLNTYVIPAWKMWQDNFPWAPEPQHGYSVGSGYIELYNFRSDRSLDSSFIAACNRLWQAAAPSKIKVFGWRLLQYRLPTRVNLWQRDILRNNHQLSCVLCFLHLESHNHLFSCRVALEI